MTFLHKLNKSWYIDDTPHFWEGVIDNPSELATWDELEYCMNNPQFYNLQFIDKNTSQPFNPNKYPRSWSIDCEDVEDVFGAYKDGHALIIQNFDSGFRKKQAILNEVETHFSGDGGIQTAMHLYSGLGECSSFPVHEDQPSNFICQVEGETNWKIYKNRCSEIAPKASFTIGEHQKLIDNMEVAIDVNLSPGDVLYIPPRTYHQARPQGPRLSVSIPMQHAIPHMKPKERSWYTL